MPSSKGPEVARVEDYDEDKGKVKSGSVVEARCPPAKPLTRSKTTTDALKTKEPPTKPKVETSKTKDAPRQKVAAKPKEGASDSGYSSHASDPRGRRGAVGTESPSTNTIKPQRPEKASTSTRNKPSVRPIDTRPDQQKAPTRSSSTSRQKAPCDDLWCQNSICHTARYPGYPGPSPSHQGYPPQQYSNPAPYGYPEDSHQYGYPQGPQASPISPRQPRARPRSGSFSGAARPVSIHGYTYPSNHGPPPSQSAWRNEHFLAVSQGFPQPYPGMQAPMYVAPQPLPNYPASPLSTSPTLARTGGPPGGYSTRVPTAGRNVFDLPSARGELSTSNLSTISTRQEPRGILRRTNRNSQVVDFVDYEDLESTQSFENPDYYYEEPSRRSRRDSQHVQPGLARRPSLRSRYATDPVDPHRGSYEPARRVRTDDYDYVDSFDNMDSDRTVVDRRETFANSSRNNRRPSITTTNPSGRTREAAIPSKTTQREIHDDRRDQPLTYRTVRAPGDPDVERASRRHSQYYPQEDFYYDDLVDNATAYQDRTSGTRNPPLTAENIRQQTSRSNPSRRGSVSHSSARNAGAANGAGAAAGGASTTASRRAVRTADGGLQVITGDTIWNFCNEQSFEFSPARDGIPAQVFVGAAPPAGASGSGAVGSGGGRDSAYYGSGSTRGGKSSKGSVGSIGRARVRRDTLLEDEYPERL